MNETTDDKKSLRRTLRTRLTEVGESRLHAASLAAANRLIATDAYRSAETMMIFLPLRHEIDARPIALRAWQDGKTVTVPLIGPNQKYIIPVEVRSFEEPMDEDHYGVLTPRGGRPFPVEMLDLVVAPGLGFDRRGHRLGRGCAFYDHFLAQDALHATVCGLAINEQILSHIPIEPHDVPMDMLVTDREHLVFDHRAVQNHV